MKLTSVLCLSLLIYGTAQGAVSDPPMRVARIRSIDGVTTVQDRGAAPRVRAARNWPVAPGDRVRTDDESEAELDFGAVSMRLQPSTELAIGDLQPEATEVRIETGIADIEASSDVRETIN